MSQGIALRLITISRAAHASPIMFGTKLSPSLTMSQQPNPKMMLAHHLNAFNVLSIYLVFKVLSKNPSIFADRRGKIILFNKNVLCR